MRFVCLLAACSAALAQPPAAAKREPIPGTFRAYVVQDFRSPVPPAKDDPADPDPKPAPGPASGKRNVTGFQHDMIADNELNPTVAVFARDLPAAGGPLDKLADKLMDLSAAYAPDGFGGYVFFPVLEKSYADDAKKAKAASDLLTAWAKPLDADWTKRQPKKQDKDPVPFGRLVVGLAEKGGKDAEAWKLPADGTTVVFYHRLKVVRRWDVAADGLTPGVIDEVAAEVAKELKK